MTPRRLSISLGISLFFSSALVPAQSSGPFDVLVRNARIVDGTGNPWYWGSVGIKDGRIAAVGRLESASADQDVDAKGRVLAPGFIDIHTHVEGNRSRPGIEDVPAAENFVRDGVTTIVTGNCGGSELPLGEWFSKLEETGLGINLGSFIGHNTVRSAVMGNANRAASPEELTKMEDLVSQAMQDGAVGFSTGLLYIPGTYADTGEVVRLARTAARFGGIYVSHIREQGEFLLNSIDEAATVGRESGLPVQISHFKIKGMKRWGQIEKALERVEEHRKQGVDVQVDVYPYEWSSTGMSVSLPAWSLEGSEEDIKARLRDPETRARIIAGMKEMLEIDGFPDFSFAVVASFRPDPTLEGLSIPEISRMKGRPAGLESEIETVLEIMEKGGASMIYHYMSLEDVERILAAPFAAVASDGGVQVPGRGKPHPRSYGNNARIFAEYVGGEGGLVLEDAVRRMTSLPAQRMGFKDRGLIETGRVADLVLFDPSKVRDRGTYKDPHQFSEGFDSVWVAGKAVVKDGQLTGLRPGRALRGPGAESGK